MKLLIVEDEAPTAAYLERGLSEEDFDVDVAPDAHAANAAVEKADYDVILLDVMLPGGSGFGLCLRWRELGITTPILFLTARDDISDRVQGLNLGGANTSFWNTSPCMPAGWSRASHCGKMCGIVIPTRTPTSWMYTCAISATNWAVPPTSSKPCAEPGTFFTRICLRCSSRADGAALPSAAKTGAGA